MGREALCDLCDFYLVGGASWKSCAFMFNAVGEIVWGCRLFLNKMKPSLAP